MPFSTTTSPLNIPSPMSRNNSHHHHRPTLLLFTTKLSLLTVLIIQLSPCVGGRKLANQSRKSYSNNSSNQKLAFISQLNTIPLKMSSSSSSSTLSSSQNSKENVVDRVRYDSEKDIILWKWATHQHESFHDFDKKEAEEIRSSLLDWYRKNRRKLPWRGDAPPYDGSTAGMNDNSSSSSLTSSSSKRSKVNSRNDDSQKSIKAFFNSTSTGIPAGAGSKKRTRTTAETTLEEKKEEEDEIIPTEISPYSVWVSEIMLQQTRVEAVIPYYLKWMKKFPTVHDLAAATEDEVNSHWAGLGFYRRARMLHNGAKFVVDDLNGTMPDTVEDLMKISGIGRYTASAIASIAFDTCVPVVDGNVCRVLSRLRGVANHIKAPVFKDTLGWKLAEQIVRAGDGLNAGEVNQAMMELGATYCAPSSTGIDDRDPLKKFYFSTKIGIAIQDQINNDSISINEYMSNASAARGINHCALCDPDGISMVMQQIIEDLGNNNVKQDDAAIVGHANFPTAPPKKTKREEVLAICALYADFGKSGAGTRWLMVKRPKDGLLAGQWEFPSMCLWSSTDKGTSTTSKKVGKKPKGVKKKTGAIEVPVFSLKERCNAILELLKEYDFNTSSENEEELFTAAQLWSKEIEAKRIYTINDDAPIEHIFSHVRHTMWVELCEVNDVANLDSYLFLGTSFALSDGREYRWMNADDMKSVGITSAIKKILSAVEKNQSQRTTKAKTKRRKTSK